MQNPEPKSSLLLMDRFNPIIREMDYFSQNSP